MKVARPCLGRKEELAAIDVLRSGWYTSGPRVKAFEEAYAKYVGTKRGVGVSSGTSAIYLTLQAMGIGAGDEVIIPASTFFSTATSVLRVGATPIFADINSDTYCINPWRVEEQINDNTKAIIPVHLYGGMADMYNLRAISDYYNVPLITDCAQAHGATYRGKKAGSLGYAGTWSFFATKNMTTCGESGMVTTDDEELADLIKVLRSHGMTDRDTHSYLGYNDRMDEIAAAIGLVQLERLEKFNRIREKHSLYLREALEVVEWLKTPPVAKHVKHVWFWCPFEVNEKKLGKSTSTLRNKLKEQGVETRHRYTKPLYKQPILSQFKHLHDYSKDYCPIAERTAGKMIGLPNHPLLTREELDYVIKIVKEQSH